MAVSSIAKKGFWRDAAAIIMPARWTGATTSPLSEARLASPKVCDYKCLMVKRSDKSKFSASNHVYPGGTVSDSDYDPKWIDFFRNNLPCSYDDLLTSLQVPTRRPPMMRKSFNGIPADIALRLCAIRETFEEAGILLAKPASHFSREGTPTIVKSSNAFLPDNDSVFQKWREAIQPDASKFLDMCIELQVVPNIWSLCEWSNWLTPVMGKVEGPTEKPRRYDTMFYICALDTIPHAVVDQQEIVSLDWLSPIDVIAARNAKEITTGFPQAYESLRLANLSKYDDLINFSVMRSRNGIGRIFGVILVCSDGYVLLHEGDELYPSDPDFEGLQGPMVTEQTISEVLSAGKAMDRASGTVGGPGGKSNIIYNLDSHPDGHRPLLTEDAVLELHAQQNVGKSRF